MENTISTDLKKNEIKDWNYLEKNHQFGAFGSVGKMWGKTCQNVFFYWRFKLFGEI